MPCLKKWPVWPSWRRGNSSRLIMKLISTGFIGLFAATGLAGSSGHPHGDTDIVPGAPWYDETGELIQAHGGGMLKHGDVWYWYGENKRHGYYPSAGISCYSSTNLVDWKHEGVVCPIWVQEGTSIVPNTPERFRTGTLRAIIERPKVIYNGKTGKFVMWMHLEGHTADGSGYQISSAGVAVSDAPTGPFEFVDFFRPVPAELHRTFSTETSADQYERGSTFRDMALFKDDDGRAYVIYAAESNYTMHIIELTDDYCGILPLEQGKSWNRILVQEHREAPAPFKYNGKYYLMTSGCSGWTPNPARMYVSDNILGPYTSLGNPCHGWKARTTFDSQSTFVLPIDPERGLFMYMGDRWQRGNIGESSYIWLPLTIEPDGKPVISNVKGWNPLSFER